MLKKIISGAQTGADRAAIDAAMDASFPYGGYIPKGRIAEDGIIPEKYSNLKELPRRDYISRTRKNIEVSDGTVVLHRGIYGRGTEYTIDYAKKIGKPVLNIDLSKVSMVEAREILLEFIESNNVEVLNVAGPRLSISPEIYSLVYRLLTSILL